MNKPRYGENFYPLMAMFLALGNKAKRKFNALPEEEQKRIIKKREEEEKLRRINNTIQTGKCPDCGGKLTRGKKDKSNGYKRKCECLQCGSVYYR